MAGGLDPDFHRRALADAIEGGAYPQWDLGVQVMPDSEDEMFKGIVLLDPTKFIPEELCPVRIIGTMTLDRNPTNCFAETEQVAFNPSNLVLGVNVTNDPLLQARLFSYLDTQITRLGGPNWTQIPINRAHAPVNDNLRDSFHQSAVHGGVAPYRPNSLDGGCPFLAGEDEEVFLDLPATVAASVKERANPQSFSDHFTQAGLFSRSLSPVEKDHVVAAYTFELSRCWDITIRKRQLLALANIHPDLCQRVAEGLGLQAPEPTEPPEGRDASAALSQLGGEWPVAGRQVGIVIGADADSSVVQSLRECFDAEGVVPLVVGPHGGVISGMAMQRSYAVAASIEFDAVVVVGAIPPAADARTALDAKAGADGEGCDPRVVKLLAEAWRHAKAIGAIAGGSDVLLAAGVDPDAPGVVTGPTQDVADGMLKLLAGHRSWDRFEPVSS